jgi:hypothetical protein
VPITADNPSSTSILHLSNDYDFMPLLQVTHASTQHLRCLSHTALLIVACSMHTFATCSVVLCRVDCPALKVPPDLITKNEELVLAVLEALQPSQRLLTVVSE